MLGSPLLRRNGERCGVPPNPSLECPAGVGRSAQTLGRTNRMSRRTNRLAAQLSSFVKQYGRSDLPPTRRGSLKLLRSAEKQEAARRRLLAITVGPLAQPGNRDHFIFA